MTFEECRTLTKKRTVDRVIVKSFVFVICSTNLPMTNDADLIREYLRTKSSSASFAFVSRHQDSVFGLSYSILKHQEEAEEVAQDAFLKFFDSLEKLRDVEKFKSWLLSITYRTAIDQYRKRKPPSKELNEVPEDYVIDDFDPQKIMQKNQRTHLLETLFDSLDKLDASILTLYYIEDMSVKMIAETLNQSESNTKIRLMRSREILRKKMTPAYRQALKN